MPKVNQPTNPLPSFSFIRKSSDLARLTRDQFCIFNFGSFCFGNFCFFLSRKFGNLYANNQLIETILFTNKKRLTSPAHEIILFFCIRLGVRLSPISMKMYARLHRKYLFTSFLKNPGLYLFRKTDVQEFHTSWYCQNL